MSEKVEIMRKQLWDKKLKSWQSRKYDINGQNYDILCNAWVKKLKLWEDVIMRQKVVVMTKSKYEIKSQNYDTLNNN